MKINILILNFFNIDPFLPSESEQKLQTAPTTGSPCAIILGPLIYANNRYIFSKSAIGANLY